jgi:hypothetical protein
LSGSKVDCRLDQEDADQAEADHAGEVPERADPLDPLPRRGAHLLGLGVVEELPADAPVPLIERDPEEDRPGDADDPGTRRPAENPAVVLFALPEPLPPPEPSRISIAIAHTPA